MELNTYKISESVLLDHIKTDRFKKARFSVSMTLPAETKNYAVSALLMPTSMRATDDYADFASLCRRCDELYAADIADMASLRGGYSTIGLRAHMLGNRYATEAEREAGFDILDGVMQLMSQIIEKPRFRENDIENEKINLSNRIRSQVNDSFGFAIRRLREIMMKGEPGVVTSEEALDMIASVKRAELAEFREYLLSCAKVEFYYCGEESHERVEELIKKHFSVLLGEKSIKEATSKQRDEKPARFIDEEGDYGQSNLLLGFRSGIRLADPEFYAAELANEIFGEGPVSKLFINVREKRSLCYFCGSGYDEINGVVTAGCGIAASDREEAQSEIFTQLEELKKGNINDSELEAAKQSIFSDCLEAEDHPEDYEDFSRMARAFGGPRTISEYRDGIAAVTKEEIAAAARRFSLDTVYFLRGTLNKEEEDQ